MSVFSIICNSEKKYIYLLIIISIIHGFHGFIFTCIPFIFKEPILICTSKNDHSFSFSCDQNTACDNFIYEINHASSQMSLTTEFELICSKRFIRVTIQSLNFLGLTVAALTMVFVKINPYHRLKIMMICNGIASVSAIISSLLYNIWAIALALFSSYFFSYIWYVNVYLYSNETFRLPLRKIVPSILGSSFGVGTIFFSLFALFVENWRYHMAFYKGFPLLVLIGFLYLYNRKYDIQPINIENEMKNKRMQNSNRKKVGICEAFQKKSLRTNILVLLFVWNINALAFSGCGVYLSSSSSNLNLTMFLLGTVQAVCCLISGNLFLKFKVEKLLRFTTTFISFFFLLFLFEPDHKNNLENKFSLFFTICLVMGNIGIELNWPILCTFMHKYVPRKFHQNVFSLATMRIMVFLVPYYIELMLYFSITPIFGFGLLALLSRIFLNFVKKHEEDGNGLLFELIKFELNKLEETEYANTKRWNESSED